MQTTFLTYDFVNLPTDSHRQSSSYRERSASIRTSHRQQDIPSMLHSHIGRTERFLTKRHEQRSVPHYGGVTRQDGIRYGGTQSVIS